MLDGPHYLRVRPGMTPNATAGMRADLAAGAVMARLAAGELEIDYGLSEKFRLATRGETEELLKEFNG